MFIMLNQAPISKVNRVKTNVTFHVVQESSTFTIITFDYIVHAHQKFILKLHIETIQMY